MYVMVQISTTIQSRHDLERGFNCVVGLNIRVGPFFIPTEAAVGIYERCELPQRGLGEPQTLTILVNVRMKKEAFGSIY